MTIAVTRHIQKETDRLVKKHFGRDYVPADGRYVFQRTVTGWGSDAHLDGDRLELLEYAMGQAVAAGQKGNWGYVNGILEKLAFREIRTARDAIIYDMERPDKEADYDS